MSTTTDQTGEDLWVFAYGSLMWRPGFEHCERRPALLRGYRRRLCLYSDHYRGTAEKPGLVLGLDEGGACRGVAYRVDAERREAALGYLREREMLGGAYRESWPTVELDDAREVTALCYVAIQTHPRYVPEMERETMLAVVRQGVGTMGPDVDYVLATHDHLEAMGVVDPDLTWLAEQLRGAKDPFGA
jgi:glutathione-specific gamma-glutamylcyclotransferase